MRETKGHLGRIGGGGGRGEEDEGGWENLTEYAGKRKWTRREECFTYL
jgi:hypothetical protein